MTMRSFQHIVMLGASAAALSVAPALLRAQVAVPDARLDALVALAESRMKRLGVPGAAIGIVHNGVV
ncbi:hypothetical protein [Gemmatimonas sp.]|uniref:hypothetical protein n=1 Tax=Gemmatimonas sp. TaxID=1962908 RepID=UPI00286D5869|nr:hypothetical protein [Gemmatimonas sp.]